jgi:hypothetical protein
MSGNQGVNITKYLSNGPGARTPNYKPSTGNYTTKTNIGSATGAGTGSGIARILSYLLAIFIVIIVILLFINYFITPIFR